MEPLHAVEPGGWLLSRVGGWGRVGGVAGTGFEAYARILHPPEAWHDDRATRVRFTWAEVARRNRRVMHPLVQWFSLTDDERERDFDDGWHVGQTTDGQLAPDLLAALTVHLARATSTPDDLTAAVWNGWGELHPDSGVAMVLIPDEVDPEEAQRMRESAEAEWREERRRATATVQSALARGNLFAWPGREMLLFGTSLGELADPGWVGRAGIGGIMPQMIWPADRRWVVASEIDWDSTIVAGPRALIDAVLAGEAWEAFEVHEDSDLTWDGDTVNPRPQGRMDP